MVAWRGVAWAGQRRSAAGGGRDIDILSYHSGKRKTAPEVLRNAKEPGRLLHHCIADRAVTLGAVRESLESRDTF